MPCACGSPPYWARALGGGLVGGIRIGDSGLIGRGFSAEIHETAWNQVDGIFLAMFEALEGLAAFALFALRTQEREYLWFGLWLLLSSAIRCLFVYGAFHPMVRNEHDLVWQVLFIGTTLASMAFYFRLLQGERNWLFWIAIASVAANAVLLTCGLLELISVALWIEIGIALTLPPAIWSVELLIRRAFEGLPDARLLVAPVLLQQMVAFLVRTLSLGYVTGWYHIEPYWLFKTSTWPFQFSMQDVADVLFLVGMLAIMIRRFSRTSRQEDEHQREREAARSVQQLLIAEKLPVIPGFRLQSVYKPAGQVGCDFFQILPIVGGAHPDSVLIAIGDVSGKGLPAALTVSLIVGAVGSLVRSLQSPGEILRALNERMLSRSHSGFTTCLVVRVDPDGALTLANAGHLAPYLQGKELQMEGSLPLGLAAGQIYAETTWMLPEGAQLMLLTDGVVEARARSGELFGFERTADLASQPAESIAEAAEQFGQEDDITVLMLTRLGGTPSSTATHHAPVVSPAAA